DACSAQRADCCTSIFPKHPLFCWNSNEGGGRRYFVSALLPAVTLMPAITRSYALTGFLALPEIWNPGIDRISSRSTMAGHTRRQNRNMPFTFGVGSADEFFIALVVDFE